MQNNFFPKKESDALSESCASSGGVAPSPTLRPVESVRAVAELQQLIRESYLC